MEPHLTSIRSLLLTSMKMKNGGDAMELAADAESRRDQMRKWTEREMRNEDAEIAKGDAKQAEGEGGKDETLTTLKRATAAAGEGRMREDKAATALRVATGGGRRGETGGEGGRKRALREEV
ncbi:hypothetical protein ACLOJK_005463 [Asimina triloba]